MGPGARAIYGSRIMPLHQPSAHSQATFYMRFLQPSSTKTTSATPDSIGMLKYGDAPRCLDGTKANRARIKNKDETRDFLWQKKKKTGPETFFGKKKKKKKKS